MRAFKRFNNRGFTLIELMIVVAIVGVLAALAIYGVRKYLLNAKTAEAKNAVGQMAKDAKTAYERESMDNTVLALGTSAAVSNNLCATATATVPSAIASVAGKKYQSDPTEWGVDAATATAAAKGFACLKFSVTDPQYYMYGYTGGSEFTATGNGDLNGDSVSSVFSLSGKVQNGAVIVAPNFLEVLPEE